MVATVSPKTPAQIYRDILTELRWDHEVDMTDVGVQVDDGVVILTGSVPSYSKRMAAQDAAHRVSGVLDVVNEIAVRVPGVSDLADADIARALRNALDLTKHFPGQRIETTVSNGWVTLEGSVDHYNQLREAERAILGIHGVRGLTNKILVDH